MRIDEKELNKLSLDDLQLFFNNWLNAVFPDKELGQQLKNRIVELTNPVK